MHPRINLGVTLVTLSVGTLLLCCPDFYVEFRGTYIYAVSLLGLALGLVFAEGK